MTDRKEHERLIRLALAQGWERVRSASHVRLRSPDGYYVSFAGTPSDHRGLRNKRAELKRKGLRL